MNKNSQPIRFQPYNPYEARYPGLKVVSRETLHLIKVIRSQGYSVIVEPENDAKLTYFTRKGLQDLLSDPVMLFVINIPISIITGIVSAWLYDLLKRPVKPNDIKVSIEIDENGQKARYDHQGDPISNERFELLLSELSNRSERYTKVQHTQPPDSKLSIPIHLEHSDKIIGWAEKLSKDDMGIKVEGVRIVDDETWQRIQNNELKGISIGGIVLRSTCTICNGEYTDCNHITNISYGNEICGNQIDSFRIAEISIVAEPVNPLAQIRVYR
jgi:hypothetical protein